MSYSRTWNAAAESSPADGDEARFGAQQITNLRKDIRERVDLEHYFDIAGTDAWHGIHTPPLVLDSSTSRTLGIGDEIVVFNSSSSVTITLPVYTTFPNSKHFRVVQLGSGVLTVNRSGSDGINGLNAISTNGIGSFIDLYNLGTGAWYACGHFTEAWNNFTPATGWTVTSQGSYRYDAPGVVRLRGVFQTTSLQNYASNIYTQLPSGYRPPYTIYEGMCIDGTDSPPMHCSLEISTSGVIRVLSLVGWGPGITGIAVLDGITFTLT